MAKAVDPVIAMLGTVDLFEGLSNKELAVVRDEARDAVVAAGDVIVREGESDRRFYLILHGDAEISIKGNPIRRLGGGDYFGEVSVLDGGERTATITAVTDVKLLTLAHFNMKGLIKAHPDLAYKLMLGLCGVLRRASNRAAAH